MTDAPRGIVIVERRVDAGAVAKEGLQRAEGTDRTEASRVEFHAIARRKDDGAGEAIDPADSRESLLDSMRADSKFLPDLKGSALVVETGTEDIHGLEDRYWIPGKVIRATANTAIDNSASRLGARECIPFIKTIAP
jgi:hypothetical protein